MYVNEYLSIISRMVELDRECERPKSSLESSSPKYITDHRDGFRNLVPISRVSTDA